MKYVALLRGINVGGNSLVKVAELKVAFEDLGYENVLTYINSGNVVFDSKITDQSKLTKQIETAIFKKFSLPIRVIVKSLPQMEKIVDEVPKEWKSKNDIRCYIAFLLDSAELEEIEVREGIDSLKTGDGVFYMTTKINGLTKSKFNKPATKKIYKQITIRNFNTTQKILGLMSK